MSLPLLLAAALAATPAAAPAVAPPVPGAWIGGPVAARPPADAYWRSVVEDEVLRDLLDRAGQVYDVEAAASRLAEAEALRRAAGGSLFPSLGLSGDVGSSAGERQVGVSTASASLSLSAPLDLSGALTARRRAAAARQAASASDLAQARILARRTAGQLYGALRAAQASRAAAQRAQLAAETSLGLARSRAAAGLDSALAVAQAQAAVDAARARVPRFLQAETQARLGLEALLGEAPGAFVARLAPAPAPLFDARGLLDAPPAVVARRPDLMAASARLRAAGLDARAAQADRWPSLSLALSATQASATRLVTPQPTGASALAGLGLVGVLFDFGRLDALAAAADARARAEVAVYRQAVSDALAEVEREIDRLARATDERDAAQAAVASAKEQARLARVRYTAGLTTFLDVLVAERAVADADLTLASAEGVVRDAGVSLAAALGLGQDGPGQPA